MKPHLSGPHLSGLFTYLDKWLRNNYDYINKEWLAYPEIHLSGQSAWEQRWPDMWWSTVYILHGVITIQVQSVQIIDR